MAEILRSGGFVFRDVEAKDFTVFKSWFSADPDHVDWMASIATRDEFLRRFEEQREDGRVVCCVVALERRPIAYLDLYPSLLWFHVNGPVPGERPWGMNVLVGDPADRNRGLGTRLVRVAAEHLLRDRQATRAVVDPESSNLAAVRCYEKAGFRKVTLIPANENDGVWYEETWLMELAPSDVVSR